MAPDTGSSTPIGGWNDPEQVDWYTSRIGGLEPRRAGEEVLIEVLPDAPRRVLDLGCGDGRLGALVLDASASVEHLVAVDRSPPMLERARSAFRRRRASRRTPVGPRRGHHPPRSVRPRHLRLRHPSPDRRAEAGAFRGDRPSARAGRDVRQPRGRAVGDAPTPRRLPRRHRPDRRRPGGSPRARRGPAHMDALERLHRRRLPVAVARLRPAGRGQSSLKKARTSSTKRSGTSIAAK